MKVILQRDIPKVGHDGEVVEVKAGYARNYLIPRSFALPATASNLKAHNSRLNHIKGVEAKTAGDAKATAEKLDGLVIQILGKVGAGTKLYGSVTTQELVERIKAASGIEVDKRRVGLVDPIKSLGTYPVRIRLHSEAVATVTVDVTTEEEVERRKAAEAEAKAAEAAAAEA